MKSLGLLLAAVLVAGAEQPLPAPEAEAPAPAPAVVERSLDASEAAEASETSEEATPETPADQVPPAVQEGPGPYWPGGVMVDPDVRTVTGIGPHFDLGVL